MNASKKSGKKSVTAKSQKSTKNPKNNKLQTKAGKSIFERFTGLTLAEFLKLKKLKKTLSGDNGQSGKQISTQQTITFDKMYQDGICKVRKNYYTKMIEFYDLNYVLLDEEERADILGLYSQLINYFDPTISFQIFLFNRHVNEETLAAQFEISPQGDKFDDIREEFSDMLKSLSAKGNNGVIKSKYIIFGIEAENIKEARQRFISLEADIIKNLKNLGTNAKCLDGKERLRVLYEFFNQDKMEPFHFSFKEMAESGNTVKDYIAPQALSSVSPADIRWGICLELRSILTSY